MSAHRTGGSGSSSLLPTPVTEPATGNGHARNLGKEVQLLPTPRTSDTNGPGQHGTGGPDLRTLVAELLPTPQAHDAAKGNETVENLLPTPRATDGTNGGPNQRGSSGDLMLPSAVQLLPTPTAMDSAGSRGYRLDGTPYTGTAGVTLTDAAMALLPTPTATPYGNNQSPSPGAAVRPSLDTLFSGASTDPLSDDGSDSPDQLPHRPS
jgi:hypothetical protein